MRRDKNTLELFPSHPRHARKKTDREGATVYDAVIVLRSHGRNVYRAGAGRHRVGRAELKDAELIELALVVAAQARAKAEAHA